MSGLICGISVTLGVAATFPGGLGLFLINTVQDNVILAGTCTSFGVSMSVSIIVSCLTHKIKSSADELMEWQKTQDIDNPLNPWELNYREDLKGMEYDDKPSVEQMNTAFRSAKITAYIAGSVAILVVAVVIPGIMASMPVLSKSQFAGWVTFTQMWAVLMAIVVIIAPPFEEISIIVKQVRKNRGGNMNEEKVIQDESNAIMLKGTEYTDTNPAPANV